MAKAYVAALLAGENVHILNESAGMLRHEAEIAQARLQAGDISDFGLVVVGLVAGSVITGVGVWGNVWDVESKRAG